MDRRTFLQGLASLPVANGLTVPAAAIAIPDKVAVPALPENIESYRRGNHASRGWSFRNFYRHSGVLRTRAEALRYAARRQHENVLLILGSTGNGKSHIAYALARALRETIHASGHSRWVACVNGGLLCSSSEPSSSSLTEPWRADGGLVVDDAHFLLSHRSYRPQLLAIINDLRAEGLPVVLTMPLEDIERKEGLAFVEHLSDLSVLTITGPSQKEAGRISYSVAANAGFRAPRELFDLIASRITPASMQEQIDAVTECLINRRFE